MREPAPLRYPCRNPLCASRWPSKYARKVHEEKCLKTQGVDND